MKKVLMLAMLLTLGLISIAASAKNISTDQNRKIEGNEAAKLVRKGSIESPDNYAATDAAIIKLDKLIAKWSTQGKAAEDNLQRARFDRMVALHDRLRMNEVIEEYNALREENVEVPDYALSTAASAYLYNREPKQARDIYLTLLDNSPYDINARIGLFYCYIELEDFDSAYSEIDTLAADPSLTESERGRAMLIAANARLYGYQLAESEVRMNNLKGADLREGEYQGALASIYAARGWPRKAQATNDAAINITGLPQRTLEIQRTGINYHLQNYREVEKETADLYSRYPEDRHVQRTAREWQVHNMAEASINARYAFRSNTSVAGGEGFGVEGKIYSQPINYNWRIFGSEFYGHQKNPNAEGQTDLSQTSAGVEYRGGGLTASLAPTFQRYDGGDELGARADASLWLSDYVEVGGYGELFSRDTPLRALNAGTTADAAGIHATFRASESQSVRINAAVMPFSDDNLRTSLGVDGVQRLYTEPHWNLNAIAGIGASQNSADQNRPYYNPSSDLLATAGVEATQILYRKYEYVYEHAIQVVAGPYWQENYGTSTAARVLYTQTLRPNDVFEIGWGVSLARQAYDGEPENNLSVLFNISRKF